MKFKFLQSASVLIEDKDVKILCDPWLTDGEYFGSWAHYPHYDFNPRDFDDVDFIYISHVHPDHLSIKTLSKLRKDIPVIIHHFPEDFMKKPIERLGFEVRELFHDTRIHLKNNLHINILAADNCDPRLCGRYFGCSLLETKFGGTSIDTLSVIDNEKEVIVNTNDCPIELALDSALKIKNKYKNIDMLLVGYAGASCWPQCIDYTQEQLQNAIVQKKQRYLKMAEEYVKLFNPKFFMPFAGRYTLAGKMINLNFKRGEPELEEAFDYLSSRFDQNKNKCLVLNVNGNFDITKGKADEPYQRIDLKQKENYIKNILSKRKLDFENEPQPSISELEKLIPDSYERFESKRKEIKFSSDFNVLINLPNDKFLCISCKGQGFKIITQDEIKNLKKYVKFTLDSRLLKWLLQGPDKAHWNNAEVGSLIHFKRVPDIYERALHYCFCFFFS